MKRWEHGYLECKSRSADANYRFMVVNTMSMEASFFEGLGEAIEGLGEDGWEMCTEKKGGGYWFKREVKEGGMTQV